MKLNEKIQLMNKIKRKIQLMNNIKRKNPTDE